MARILFAWELGANLGHLGRMLPVAEELRAMGHAVSFAVRDLRGAAWLLLPRRFAFTQAPLAGESARPVKPGNYAEMLLLGGYRDQAGLAGRVAAWLTLYDLTRCDVVVLDHAPTARFAACLTRLPAVAYGSGFEIPPDVSPWPAMRPWEEVSGERLRQAGHALLEAINAAAWSFGHKGFAAVGDVFNWGDQLLATFPELDHYGARPQGRYFGPPPALAGGDVPVWPDHAGPRLFAYLRRDIPGFGALIEGLRGCGANVLAMVPGGKAGEVAGYRGGRVRITPRPVDLSQVLPGADGVVTYGGIGTVATGLMAGLPLLIAPRHVEQALLSLRVKAIGAGIFLAEKRDPETVASKLRRLLADPSYQTAARGFAGRYRGFDAQGAVAEVAAIIAHAATGRDDAANSTNTTNLSNSLH